MTKKFVGYKQSDYSLRFNVIINTDKWVVYLYTKKRFKHKVDPDDDVHALCEVRKKVIYFREDFIDFETIVHEVKHAYFSYLCLESTSDIKSNDMEEIGADFISKNLGKLLSTSFIIQNKLQKINKKAYKNNTKEEMIGTDRKNLVKASKMFQKMLEFPDNNQLVELFKMLADIKT